MSPDPATPRRLVEAVIFDLGNTLLYFDGEWPVVLAAADEQLFAALEAAGLQLDRAAFLVALRRELEAYYQEREAEFIEYTTLYVLRTLLAEWGYPDVPDTLLRPAIDAMYAVSQVHWVPEPEMHAVLAELKAQGYRLGLISNAADDRDVQTLVDKAGIRGYFEYILTSAGQGIRKPNPRIFHQMLARLDVPPERAIMVGDTLGADVLGAANAGLRSVWITRRADSPANRAHADTIKPDYVVEGLGELPGLLKSFAS